jgi:creatinine amidohydrolase/Fe(II)-dependent formamide hydrolase-like protein
MVEEMNIAEMTWQEVRAALQSTDLLIYPLGATETYGPHLPTGLEIKVADWVGTRLGQRTNALVMPTLPISCSQVNDAFPGNLFVPPSVVRDYLLESCRCLTRYGIKQVFFLNVHGPNLYPIEEAVRALQAEGVRASQTDFWRFVGRRIPDLLSDDEHRTGHASEMATAMMLAIDPAAVRQDRYSVSRPEPGLHQEYLVPDVNLHVPWHEIAPSGHLGDPSKASAEQGRQILERAVDDLASLLAAWTASSR